MNSKNSTNKEIRKKIARRLYEVEGIKFGEFTLTSGKSSPYYVDLRIVPSYPKLFDEITEACAEMIDAEIKGEYRLAGVPTSGLPFATLVSHKLSLPLIYVRKKEKSHGRKKSVEGLLEEDEIVLVDDISTTGGSIKEAGETVREEGGNVKHAVVIIDREEGAEEALKDMDIQLHACFKISEIVEYLKEDSSLSEDEYSLVMNHLENT